MNLKYLSLIICILILLVPLSVVYVVTTDSSPPYTFQATVQEKLDETLGGKLQYFLTISGEGTASGSEVVLTIDTAYTRGITDTSIEKGTTIWVRGEMMDRETYYGDQYLFFGYPQVYVRQVKEGIFWPDQTTGMKTLYQSPVTSLFAPAFVWYFPFTEEYSSRMFLVLLTKTLLIVSTVIFLIRSRHEKEKMITIVLIYCLMAIILTIPILTDLY